MTVNHSNFASHLVNKKVYFFYSNNHDNVITKTNKQNKGVQH